MKQSIFITGASGFLGSQILRRLKPEMYSRIVLLSRHQPDLPEQLANAGNVTMIAASIEDTDKYASYLDENSVIIHLAAVTGKASPDEYFRVNTDGTRKLVRVAESANVTGFLFVSSIAVSFRDRKGYVYADSKQKAEHAIQTSSLDFSIVRPTIILGENSPIWHSFFNLAKSSLIILPGSGRVKIQPIDVDDMVTILLSIVNNGLFENTVMESGGPDVITMDEFVIKIHNAVKKNPPRIIHLPLGIIVGLLRIFEKVFPSLLPVNSGQFASFNNDGVATKHDLPIEVGKMKNIDEIIFHLVEISRSGGE